MATKKTGNPIGRPSRYSKKIAEAICNALIDGMTLRKICASPEMPSVQTVMNWLKPGVNPEFLEQYARARELQAELMADEILEIADDASQDTVSTEHGERADKEWIARSKLRVQTRQWLMGKHAAKKYGAPDKTGAGKDKEDGQTIVVINGGLPDEPD